MSLMDTQSHPCTLPFPAEPASFVYLLLSDLCMEKSSGFAVTGTILREGTGLQKPLAEGKVSVLFLFFFCICILE